MNKFEKSFHCRKGVETTTIRLVSKRLMFESFKPLKINTINFTKNI